MTAERGFQHRSHPATLEHRPARRRRPSTLDRAVDAGEARVAAPRSQRRPLPRRGPPRSPSVYGDGGQSAGSLADTAAIWWAGSTRRSAGETRVAASHPITTSRGGTPAMPIERSDGLASSSAATTARDRGFERERGRSDQPARARSEARSRPRIISSRCMAAREHAAAPSCRASRSGATAPARIRRQFPRRDEIGEHDRISAGRGGERSRLRHPRGELLDRRRLQDVERLASATLTSGSIRRTSRTRLRRASVCDECAAERTGPDHRDHRHARWNIL